jgi:signal transduction histidine kinase
MTEEYVEANEFAIRSTKRLNNILDVLGIFIYFTNSEYRKQKIDIISLLNNDIVEFRTKISEKNIKIVKLYNTKNPIFKIIDREPLLLCFRNILKNAIRYSHEN